VSSDIRLRNLLVAGQLATATMLLVGAGLLVNSFSRLARVDPGWNASGLLTFYLVIPQEYSTTRKAMLIEELLGELRRMPGGQGAGFTYAGPLLGLIAYLYFAVRYWTYARGDAWHSRRPSNPLGEPRLPPDNGCASTGWPLARAA
jgi:hypothetical protein